MDYGQAFTVTTADAADQTVGIRFARLTVPSGATILRAWVQFTADREPAKAPLLHVEYGA